MLIQLAILAVYLGLLAKSLSGYTKTEFKRPFLRVCVVVILQNSLVFNFQIHVPLVSPDGILPRARNIFV
jgi:hypothetical protein